MKKIIVFLLVSIISLSGLAPAVLAKSPSMQGGDRVILEKDEVVDDNYFAGGESVIVSGIVNGDAYVAGGSVTVDGTINGDLLIAGGDLDIRGTVTGDIRAGGGNITLSGKLGGNLTIGAGKVIITDSAVIGGSIVAGAGDLSIAAPVAKGITAGVGRLYISNRVTGDVNYWSEEELVMSGDATVSGTLTRHAIPQNEKKAQDIGAGVAAGMVVGFKLFEMLGLFIIGAILIRLLPVYTKEAVAHMRNKSWHSLFVGFCAVILIPVFLVIMMMTIIGIPLALLGFMILIIILGITKLFGALLVGTRVMAYFGKNTNQYLALAVGIVLYYLILLVPVLGWIVGTGIYLIALGGLLTHHRDFYMSLRTKKLI